MAGRAAAQNENGMGVFVGAEFCREIAGQREEIGVRDIVEEHLLSPVRHGERGDTATENTQVWSADHIDQ